MFLGSSLALGPVGSSPESRLIKDLFNRAGVAVAGRDGTLVQSGGTGSTALHPTTAAVAASGALISHSLALAGAGTLPMSFAQGARTNLLLQSQNFQATWTPFNVTFGAKAAAPDGSTTADAITATATNQTTLTQPAVTTVATTTYSFSVYARNVTAGFVVLIAYDGGSNARRQWFNLATGAVANTTQSGTYTKVSADMVPVGGGWYRCTLVITTPAGVSTIFSIDASDTNGTQTCGAGKSIQLWGAQVEQASFPGVYIPTTSASLTRAADNILWTPPSALSTTSGEVVAVTAPYLWSAGAGANGPMAAATIWCNRASNFAMYRDTTELVSRQDSAGSRTVSAAALSESSGVLKSRSVKWGADVRGYHDATSYGTPVAIVTPPWLSTTDLRVGRSYGSDTLHAYGFVGLIYIPNGLTDAERSALARLTIGTLNYVG